MDSSNYIAAIVAILSTSGIAAVINWIRDHRKDKAAVEQSSISALREIIAALREENERLQQLLERKHR